MQKLTSRSLLALGAIGLALLPLSGAAQAGPKYKDKNKGKGGPPDHAPAYGHHKRGGNGSYTGNGSDYGSEDDDYTGNYGGRDRNGGYNTNRNGGYGRGTGDDVRYGNYGRIVTLEALVTRVDSDGSFAVQAGGRNFDVTSTSGTRVRRGQRVTLRGSFDQDNNFNARNVSVVGRIGDNRNDNDPYGNDYLPGQDQRVNFPGEVTRVFNSGELEVRAENGRTYRVLPRNTSTEYQVGNRIRVTGTASGTRVSDARITFQNGGVAGGIFSQGGVFGGNRGDYGNAGDYGNGTGDIFGDGGATRGYPGGTTSSQTVNFFGRIVSINTGRRTAVVRSDNGREYPVQGRELVNYRNGERVRVRGTARYGTIELSDIQHVK